MLVSLLAACTPATTPPDEGFTIVGVSPEDGASDVVEAHIPELRFSDPIDTFRCNADTLRLDGIHDDDTVAFEVELEVLPLDEGHRVQLPPVDKLPSGWTYALSARGGSESGCASTAGDLLAPFTSTFYVP